MPNGTNEAMQVDAGYGAGSINALKAGAKVRFEEPVVDARFAVSLGDGILQRCRQFGDGDGANVRRR